MKFSSSERILAAQILSACASNQSIRILEACAALGLNTNGTPGKLAEQAYYSPLVDHLVSGPWCCVYAEAEAMIREGWTP